MENKTYTSIWELDAKLFPRMKYGENDFIIVKPAFGGVPTRDLSEPIINGKELGQQNI